MTADARCPRCARPLVDGRCSCGDPTVDARFIRRELLALIALAVTVVVGFLFTRSVAATNRALRVQDAAAWHAVALAERTTDRDRAVQALRRATTLDRSNVRYRLDLADALAEQHSDEAARQVLMEIRETTPESPDVNTRLARLAARGGWSDDAVRYYQSAIHGLWRDNEEAMRREIRLELIRYLLRHDRRSRALAELIALLGALPETSDAQLEVATLLGEAGDPARSLSLFRRVLDRDAANTRAREGAAIAAFDAGDYAAVLRYLRGLDDLSRRALEVRGISQYVVSRDPLRRGLAADERRRRLRSAVETVIDRVESCLVRTSSPDARSTLERLGREAHDVESTLRQAGKVASDAGEVLVRLAAIERQAVGCGELPPAAQALQILARRYEADQ